MLVIISHTFAIAGKNDLEPLIFYTKGHLQLSGVGLTLFFFISGYFITASATTTEKPKLFLLKRIYRIYPALIVLVVISVFIAGPLLSVFSLHQYFASKETWLYLFTATGLRIRMNLPGVFTLPSFNVHAFNASLWTIALEIELYISISIALYTGLLKNKKLFIFFSLLIVLFCFVSVALRLEISHNEKRQLNMIGIFFMGSFIYITAFSKKIIKAILLFSALLFIIFVCYKIPGFDPFFLFLIAVCMLVYCVGFNSLVKVPLHTDISYGLYIYAFPVQQIVFMLWNNQNPYFQLALGILLTLPFAFASWHLVEKRFIRATHKRRSI